MSKRQLMIRTKELRPKNKTAQEHRTTGTALHFKKRQACAETLAKILGLLLSRRGAGKIKRP